MPTRYQAPYKQSRSTLREIYGARSIDGSAPQSVRDATPSGRLKYLEGGADQTPSGRFAERMQAGATPQQAEQADQQQWRRMFPAAPVMGAAPPVGAPMAPPLGRLASGPQEFAQPDDILKAYAQGAVNGSFKTPYGPVSFDATQPSPLAMPLRTATPVPASDLSAFLPASTGTSVPWKQGAKPAYMSSVFGGASRWT